MPMKRTQNAMELILPTTFCSRKVRCRVRYNSKPAMLFRMERVAKIVTHGSNPQNETGLGNHQKYLLTHELSQALTIRAQFSTAGVPLKISAARE